MTSASRCRVYSRHGTDSGDSCEEFGGSTYNLGNDDSLVWRRSNQAQMQNNPTGDMPGWFRGINAELVMGTRAQSRAITVRKSSNCVSTSRLWGRSCHQSAHARPSARSDCMDSCSQLNLRNGCILITTRKAQFRQTRMRIPSTRHSENWNSVHVAELSTCGSTHGVGLNSVRFVWTPIGAHPDDHCGGWR